MTDPIERITSTAVPTPAGHYSHATAWRDLIFVSGQLGPRSNGSHTLTSPSRCRCAKRSPTCSPSWRKLGADPITCCG